MAVKNYQPKDILIEFIIVILGISIAFWLSNLGEDKKERALEKAYLQDIKSDLQNDLKLLTFSIEQNEKKQRKLLKGVQYFRGANNGVTLDTLVDYAGLMGNYYHFSPNDYTYLSLQQSGDFKIISKQEVKKALIALYQLYGYIEREQENVLSGLDENYFPILMQHLDLVTGEVVNPTYFNSTLFRNNMGFVLNEISTLISLYKNAKQEILSIDQQYLNFE